MVSHPIRKFPRTAAFLLLVVFEMTIIVPNANGFLLVAQRHASRTSCHSSMSDDPKHMRSTFGDDDDEEQRRMAMVRYLQQSFYKETEDSSFEAPNAENGGLLKQLPIWRVPWVELPGRTNVLNVHEAIYTNMFEKLLRRSRTNDNDEDIYFGHVYLKEGTEALKTTPLQDWQNYDVSSTSSCLGTLMRITDFQRLPNGRLLLLVQAMERFVVTQVHQNVPYAVADVQLLPDTTDDDSRIASIVQAWDWKSYEFEDTKFASRELVGSVLAQVLPYAAMDPTQLPTHEIMLPPTQAMMVSSSTDTVADPAATTSTAKPTDTDDHLEEQLIESGILKGPDKDLADVSTDELELQLWWALNDFLMTSKTPVSPILLGLLPPNEDWEEDFVLKGIAERLETTEYRHKYIPVSSAYPKRLRQRRLSFHAAYLCKDQDRHELLSMSSTKMRLQAVLWKLETYNRSFQ